MGAFMCIAKNGVPPPVSKRMVLNVNCESHESRVTSETS